MNFKKFLKQTVTVALQIEARLVLKKYRPKIVAVTGSVGKTSTKDAIYAVMATSFFVRKSSKSFNNELGVPLTVLGLQTAGADEISAWLTNILDGLMLLLLPHKYPEWLVVEIGADRPGDISAITAWLHPDIAVVTRMSDVPVHVEFFDSADQVRHEKSQLVAAAGRGGKKSTVILSADDPLVATMRPLTKGKVLTFGSVKAADVSGSDFRTEIQPAAPFFPTGISFTLQVRGREASFPVVMFGSLGKQQMYTALAALSVAEVLKIPEEKSTAALRDHDTPPGRMKILSGIHGSCIIDDTYNSSPVAAHEALEALKQVQSPAGRKIVVLGDMMELGQYSQAEHEKIGAKAATIADVLYTIGTRSKNILKAATAAGFPAEKTAEFSDSFEAGETLKKEIRAGDIVLVKGSQSMRMEKTVAAILAEPERASELLVRQEPEWKRA